MNPIPFLFLFFLFFFFSNHVQGQNQSDQNPYDTSPAAVGENFRPSIAVVIGILSIMFSLTFLILMYARFCHGSAAELFGGGNGDRGGGLLNPRSRFSGIDKNVIDSLPFFKFSSLKGSKEGLECAVCLSKFEDSEILRLLPKCKHAFHIECVDRWLENHSSCPLCRSKVDARDITLFTYSSMRLLGNASDLSEDTDIELVVQRETDDQFGSSRFSVGSSFRKVDKGKRDELLIPEGGDDQQFLHKFNHRIIVSDVVFKNRWSDLNSSDLMSLNSEMLNAISSKRFNSSRINSDRFFSVDSTSIQNDRILDIREEAEKNQPFDNKASTSDVPSTSNSVANLNLEGNPTNKSRSLISSAKRSMSEITNVSRFSDWKSRIKDQSNSGSNSNEERVRRLWLPIAKRTVQWFSGREKQVQAQQHNRHFSNV